MSEIMFDRHFPGDSDVGCIIRKIIVKKVKVEFDQIKFLQTDNIVLLSIPDVSGKDNLCLL